MKRLERKFPSKTYETVKLYPPNRKTKDSFRNHQKFISWNCESCGKQWPAFYMIKDEIWEQVADKDAMHCMSCFKKAIGRDLVINDFKQNSELNEGIILIFQQIDNEKIK